MKLNKNIQNKLIKVKTDGLKQVRASYLSSIKYSESQVDYYKRGQVRHAKYITKLKAGLKALSDKVEIDTTLFEGIPIEAINFDNYLLAITTPLKIDKVRSGKVKDYEMFKKYVGKNIGRFLIVIKPKYINIVNLSYLSLSIYHHPCILQQDVCYGSKLGKLITSARDSNSYIKLLSYITDYLQTPVIRGPYVGWDNWLKNKKKVKQINLSTLFIEQLPDLVTIDKLINKFIKIRVVAEHGLTPKAYDYLYDTKKKLKAPWLIEDIVKAYKAVEVKEVPPKKAQAEVHSSLVDEVQAIWGTSVLSSSNSTALTEAELLQQADELQRTG